MLIFSFVALLEGGGGDNENILLCVMKFKHQILEVGYNTGHLSYWFVAICQLSFFFLSVDTFFRCIVAWEEIC
jgi:hypothetical protein